MLQRVAVDFNSMMRDEQERVYIGREGSPHEDQDVLSSLHDGAWVILTDGEMEVEALLEFDGRDRVWLGRPNWATRRDLPVVVPVSQP